MTGFEDMPIEELERLHYLQVMELEAAQGRIESQTRRIDDLTAQIATLEREREEMVGLIRDLIRTVVADECYGDSFVAVVDTARTYLARIDAEAKR